MPFAHALLCYFGSADGDAVVRQAGAVCANSETRLSVVLPVEDSTVPAACCGIGSEQWKRLTDMDSREALEGAVALLEGMDCVPVHAGIEVGPSVQAILSEAAERWDCDVVLLARKRRPWSVAGLSRRRLEDLRAGVGSEVVVLEPVAERRSLKPQTKE